MVYSLRQIKNRIRTSENIKKITRAMEMVSVVKLRSAQRGIFAHRQYFMRLEGIVTDLLAGFPEAQHPLLGARDGAKGITLCVFASDTGLCGSYNNNVVRLAEGFIREHGARRVSLVAIGRKAVKHFRRIGLAVAESVTDLYGRHSDKVSDRLAQTCIDSFLAGTTDEVYAAYTRFESSTRFRPVIEKVINVERPKEREVRYLVEPGVCAILDRLLPSYVMHRMRSYLWNSFASENAARAIAMGEATNNAVELLEGLTLLRNKVRQANITKEIIEVISAADALKG